MKDKMKKTIFILLVVVSICLVILYICKINKRVKSNDYSKDSEFVTSSETKTEKSSLKFEENRNIYYTVIEIVENYINTILESNTTKLIQMLDTQYIKTSNIDESNILEKINFESLESNYDYYSFCSTKMYSVDNETISTYFIYGYYYNELNLEDKKELNLMIELDSYNQTFDIYPYSYMQEKKYDNLKIGDEFKTNKTNIKNRETNTFIYKKITEQEMIEEYLKDYTNKVLFDTRAAYELLDAKYMNKKFGNEEEFYKYINNKKKEMFIANVEQYKVITIEDGHKEYICKDQNDNNYYFIETNGVMNYNIMLDNYTIPSQEYIDKYKKASEEVKISTNIDIFIRAINDNSFYYIYNNCLSNSFKNNYFKTLAEFETYIRDNFFVKNAVEYINLEKQNELYKYTIKIINKDNENESLEKTIIMKLNEGTDFEMSFNVN